MKRRTARNPAELLSLAAARAKLARRNRHLRCDPLRSVLPAGALTAAETS